MPVPSLAPTDVQAAGVVAFRPGKRVLLVHRPKYDDWSFPKGKLERGEHATSAAVRETVEETGLHVRLGPPLGSQRYSTGGRMKTVHYWNARAVGDDDVSGYVGNEEIDEVAWVEADQASQLLTYDYDRVTLAAARKQRHKTRAVVVLRHGASRSRKAWRGDDRQRPLLVTAQHQAQRLVPVLAAYDVTCVVSSTSLRCQQTVAPYVDVTGWELRSERRLSEEDATSLGVARIVEGLVEHDGGALLCTHRPVLPEVFEALGLGDPQLATGELYVVHLRQGMVTSTERHLVR